MSNEFWLEMRNAAFSWDDRWILRDVSLRLTQPRIAWLTGPSGGGKSSFLRLVAGHYRLHSGTCIVDGKEVTEPGPARAISLQNYKLFPWKTVFENVAAGLRFADFDDAEISDRVCELLERAGLYANRLDWPHQLSGGMRQRVGILRSLAVRPRCLLLDEPFSALDEATSHQMQALVMDYLEANGASCLIASHNPDHVRQGSGHILFMRGGGTVDVIEPSLAARFATVAFADDFGSANRVESPGNRGSRTRLAVREGDAS